MLGRRTQTAVTATGARRTAAAVSALAGTAALLSGCATSASQPAGALPTAAASTSAVVQGPTALPSPSASIPSDLTIRFEPPDPVPAGLGNLVAATQEFVYAYEQAVAKGSVTDSLVQSLVTGSADVSLNTLLHQAVKNGTRPSGTVTFFLVTPSQQGSAEGVGFCENDSQAVPVSDGSGAVAGSAPKGTDAVREWNLGFSTGSGGKLIINLLATEVGSRACQ